MVGPRPGRLGIGDVRMAMANFGGGRLQSGPLIEPQGDARSRRPHSSAGQVVESADVDAEETAGNAHIPAASDVQLQFDVGVVCRDFRDALVDFVKLFHEVRPSRIRKGRTFVRPVFEKTDLVLLNDDVSSVANLELLRRHLKTLIANDVIVCYRLLYATDRPMGK